LALEKRALVIEWPTKKIKKDINHEWGLLKAIKDQLSPCCQQTQGNENSQGHFCYAHKHSWYQRFAMFGCHHKPTETPFLRLPVT
jgi:hypothetical protein